MSYTEHGKYGKLKICNFVCDTLINMEKQSYEIINDVNESVLSQKLTIVSNIAFFNFMEDILSRLCSINIALISLLHCYPLLKIPWN